MMASVMGPWVGRAVGLDVHRDFCVVAICDSGVVRFAGRVPSTPEGVAVLAESLLASDRVALEVTSSCWEVTRLLTPHVNKVIVVSPDDTGIASARAKTDKRDAKTLAVLCWRGDLDAVWMPDERCQILRRRLQRREQLVRARSRFKNEISAVFQRRLMERPGFSDLFGVSGRQWLAEVQLPLEERESVDAGLRQIQFIDDEVKAVEKLMAQQALEWPEIRRLMTVPGVNLICAATFIAAIGNASGSSPTANSSPTSVWIQRSASPVKRRHAQVGSPNAGQRQHAGRWLRRPGVLSSNPVRCVRSMNAFVPGAGMAGRSSRPPGN
jgi:transposase